VTRGEKIPLEGHPVSDRIDELLHRRLACCVCCPARSSGARPLDKFAGDLRATRPHFVYIPHGRPQALHNAGRLAWGAGYAAGRPSTPASM